MVLLNAQPTIIQLNWHQEKATVAPHYVHYVEDYVNEHECRERITLSQLVDVSGVSGRTLLEGFRRYKGTSPMKYLKSVQYGACPQRIKECGPKSSSVSLEDSARRGFHSIQVNVQLNTNSSSG